MRPETENPQEGTSDQAARQEVTSYRDVLFPVDRMTDVSKNISLPQTSFVGRKISSSEDYCACLPNTVARVRAHQCVKKYVGQSGMAATLVIKR